MLEIVVVGGVFLALGLPQLRCLYAQFLVLLELPDLQLVVQVFLLQVLDDLVQVLHLTTHLLDLQFKPLHSALQILLILEVLG